MKQFFNKDKSLALVLVIVAAVISSCTKSRDAELPEDVAPDVYEISMFGSQQQGTAFKANVSSIDAASNKDQIQILDFDQAQRLSGSDVEVPSRVKFMFDNLPLTSKTDKEFNVTFSIDKNNITAYKIVTDVSTMNAIEKSISVSAREVNLISKISVANKNEAKTLASEQKTALAEREQIKAGKASGTLLVPMFKYEIAEYGVLERTKNELKEQTSVLRLKLTDWASATHIKISSRTDARKTIGLSAEQVREMRQLFRQDKIDKRVMTAEELGNELKIGIKFLAPETKVVTKLNPQDLLVYEITDISKLTPDQLRIFKSGGSGGRVVSCDDAELKDVIKSTSADCVVVLVAAIPVQYKKLELSLTDPNGTTSSKVESIKVPKSQSVGLVEILENSTAQQLEVTGMLDPDSSIRIKDLDGEFLFRRTLEDAATSFIGRTGTSSDMNIIKFELENDRLIVRNQMSLIQYTGQGAKDREELMSVPVKYYYVEEKDAHGSKLEVGRLIETTKEKANYIKLDWTRNTIPDASSPLAFFDAGSCFIANSSKNVTGMDMRLEKEGKLNFSINSSHTVDTGCAAIKDVNSAYWAGSYQLNFNVVERISFQKHDGTLTDKQFSDNISYMAQEAFNYGVFTLADKDTNTGALNNRDGSEKYLPMIHDLRNGKTLKWYLGGINNAQATNAERRQLIVDATKQVVDEWNQIFARAFKGTQLERSGNYIELVIEDAGKETGRLGDLDRNYIWMNEIPTDNGLLGVAQPAANPRSGVIESANVIVYTGNTFEQTQILLKMTELSRSYEKMIENMKKQAIEEAKKTQQVVSTQEQGAVAKTPDADPAVVGDVSKITGENKKYLNELIKYLELDNKNMKKIISGKKMEASPHKAKRALTKNTFRDSLRVEKVKVADSSSTMTKKMAELSMNRKMMQNEREFELRVNDLFLTHGGLSDDVKMVLNKRQQLLSMSIRFDRATQNRPGCFLYSRNDINDEALAMDPDPHKNLMLNFKQAVMSTLSHELGHAFGLMHNFAASTDKGNYEFPGETTGRNYSSIMDYISDIDQHYAGPGPYDAHAIRAAYTGYVQLDDQALPSLAANIAAKQITLANNNLIQLKDLLKLFEVKSFVHFTKETLNKQGIVKHYEQCSDGGTYLSIMCNRFDTGGTAEEIVKNMIADYNRSYATRSYVYDKIIFGWPQKVQVILRNIQTFAQIRSFLDELINTAIYGSGRPDDINQAIMNDQVMATLEGYKFFHELIRMPSVNASFSDVQNRFYAIPYQYVTQEVDAAGAVTEKTVDDIKILEARSLYDLALTKEKIDTLGTNYDKIFGVNFMMMTSTTFATDDNQQGFVSYKDFEQFFMGVEDPSQSLIISTMTDVLTDSLQMGFFDPNGTFVAVNAPVEANRYLSDQAAISSVIGLYESKWSVYDPFAETFKMARARVKNAPADRLNITRIGEDRNKADTVVYYPTQSGFAANVLIKKAAYGDVFIAHKAELFKAFADLSKADLGHMNLDQTNPTVQAAKQKADALAQALLTRVRELNVNGAIMDLELDKPESKINFVEQVDLLRKYMYQQNNIFAQIKKALEAATAANLNQTIQAVVQTIQKVKTQNDDLSAVPLLGYAQPYLVENSKSQKITLVTKQEIPGDTILSMMMDGSKIQTGHEKIVDTIDRLTYYTKLVDPNADSGN